MRQEEKKMAKPKSRFAAIYEVRKPPGTWVRM